MSRYGFLIIADETRFWFTDYADNVATATHGLSASLRPEEDGKTCLPSVKLFTKGFTSDFERAMRLATMGLVLNVSSCYSGVVR